MFPWFRLIGVFVGLRGQPKVDLLATTRLRMRVWPNDLDFNLHVNNGRYLALADLGRMQWFVRTGLLKAAQRHKAMPVVGDALAKFRRDLKVFQSFEIHTRMIGWDEKWGILEHRFVRNGRVLGVVSIRGVFKGPHGPVVPAVLFQGMAHAGESPDWPEWANRFYEGSELLSVSLREEEQSRGST